MVKRPINLFDFKVSDKVVLVISTVLNYFVRYNDTCWGTKRRYRFTISLCWKCKIISWFLLVA